LGTGKEELLPGLECGSEWGPPQPQGFPQQGTQGWARAKTSQTSDIGRRGPRVGPKAVPSGGTSQWWPQDGRNCCQDWTLGVNSGNHSLKGPPIIIRGPREGPSGGTSQWWAHEGRSCCQDWTMGVDTGSHMLIVRGPRAGPNGGTSQWWVQDWRNCCQDWTVGVDRGSHGIRGHPSPISGTRAEPS